MRHVSKYYESVGKVFRAAHIFANHEHSYGGFDRIRCLKSVKNVMSVGHNGIYIGSKSGLIPNMEELS